MAIKILILAANPKAISRLHLDSEVREIEEGLIRSKFRDQFVLYSTWATRPGDLRRALLDYMPDIVHLATKKGQARNPFPLKPTEYTEKHRKRARLLPGSPSDLFPPLIFYILKVVS